MARQAQVVDPCGQGGAPFGEAQAGHGETQRMNCWTKAQMKPILPVCCFCDKAQGDTRSEAGKGLWQDLQIYMVSRKLRPEDITFAYTCCRDCLKDDPRANAFRTRLSHSGSPVLDNR